MSLPQRLKQIEQRLSTLEQRLDGQEQGLTQLVDALDAEADNDEAGPVLTLDGTEEGGERDASQPL